MVTTFPFLWDQLIGVMFGDVFGTPAIAGIFVLLFFYVFGLALRLTLELQIVTMFFATMLVVGSMIGWASTVVFLLASIFIGVFLYYIIWGR